MNRFAICEAYYALEMDFNIGGALTERRRWREQRESVGFQLYRMHFRPSPLFRGYESLSDDGKFVYDHYVQNYMN